LETLSSTFFSYKVKYKHLIYVTYLDTRFYSFFICSHIGLLCLYPFCILYFPWDRDQNRTFSWRWSAVDSCSHVKFAGLCSVPFFM